VILSIFLFVLPLHFVFHLFNLLDMTNETDLCTGAGWREGDYDEISIRCFIFIFCRLMASKLRTSIYFFVTFYYECWSFAFNSNSSFNFPLDYFPFPISTFSAIGKKHTECHWRLRSQTNDKISCLPKAIGRGIKIWT